MAQLTDPAVPPPPEDPRPGPGPLAPLISAGELSRRLGEPGLKVLDATWFFPHEARSAEAEFEAGHIPGASRFDIDAIADLQTDLPHMLPAPEAFARAAESLGLSSNDEIVVYEAEPPRSAARVWWSLRAMGHDRVRVLDGGLPAYRALGRVLESGPARSSPGRFEARLRRDLLADAAEVETAVETGAPQILDARPGPRFRGEADEPRPGLRRGRIPGALSTPGGIFFDGEGRLRPPEALHAALSEAGAEIDAPVIASCGSGITACLIALAFARLGRWDVKVYDGSFAEWGRPGPRPVLRGA